MKTGLLFPKKGMKRKKQCKHPESILQIKDRRCFLCMINGNNCYHTEVDRHHVFGGSDRKASEEEGLTVYLCRHHHVDGPAAVHNNRENDLIIKRYAQAVYEQNHTREEFQKRFRMSYL